MNIAAYTKLDISPIINKLPEDLQSRIVIRHYKSSEEIEPDLPGVDILLTTGRVKEEIIQQAPNLKWVQALSAGVDFLPLGEIARRGILLSNARGIHKIQMSEFALLLNASVGSPSAAYLPQPAKQTLGSEHTKR